MIDSWLSLDFVYTPARDVDAAVEHWVGVLGAELDWKIRAMGTTVACLRVSGSGPAVLLADHVEGHTPILVYRVSDYAATVAALRERGQADIAEIEIPHGPCASFATPSGERVAVYELTRPEMVGRFSGRIDP